MINNKVSLAALTVVCLAMLLPGQDFKFDFGAGPAADGYTRVLPMTFYDSTSGSGYGFDWFSGTQVHSRVRNNDDELLNDFITRDGQFFFSVDLPEGNYRVTLYLGGADGACTTTVKAESRRLMLERVVSNPGETVSRTFTVNRRSPRIDDNTSISLKRRDPPLPNEPDFANWDDKLTLEFTGPRPCVCGADIVPDEDAVQIFLAGNSTVVDQDLPPDYLFVEFGHNENNEDSFRNNLLQFINEARNHEAVPVLVTPANRRSFSGDVVTNSHGGFLDVVRQTARDEGTALIDLFDMTKTLYEALGPEDSKKAFMHYSVEEIEEMGWTRETGSISDNTHFNPFGAYELARCMVTGIQDQGLAFADFLVEDVGEFDPAEPDPPDEWIARWDWTPYREWGEIVHTVRAGGAGPGLSLSIQPGSYLILCPACVSGNAEFIVTDLRGTVLLRTERLMPAGGGSFTWDGLAWLPEGAYFLSLKKEQKLRSVKFIKM
jgi:lysophospholipase L1-like esterase